MENILLNTIWVGSFTTNRLDAEQAHAKVLVYAESLGLGELVSNVSADKDLVQFMIMPCGAVEESLGALNWEDIVAFSAKVCAGTSFMIKRLYVGEI